LRLCCEAKVSDSFGGEHLPSKQTTNNQQQITGIPVTYEKDVPAIVLMTDDLGLARNEPDLANGTRSRDNGIAVSHKVWSVDRVRTVSDTKRNFYAHHTRPINSVYRRVVEELMVEMHLLTVNVHFRYTPIYALGVVTTFEQFMQGYRPERDTESIFKALCSAVEGNPEQYRQDAAALNTIAQGLTLEQLTNWNSALMSDGNAAFLYEALKSVALSENYKYSRLFAIGLYSLVAQTDAEAIKDDKKRDEVLKELCETLKLSFDKLQKDLDLYRSNLEKMTQVQATIADALKADRKKRLERSLEKKPVEATESPQDEPTQES
jgi:photosystem II biogenesis protein Psp29